MTTQRQSLPPSPHTPPKAINQNTTNGDVRLFVYNLVRRYDEELDEHAAWAIARKVRGDGEAILRFKRERWIELLGDWGDLVYEKIESQKYVDIRFGHTLKIIQSILLVVAGCITGYDLSKSNEFKYTKGFGIAFLVYTGVVRILHAIVSTRWFENSTRFPTFLKHRPARPGQSLHSIQVPIENKEGARGSRNRLPFHQDID